MLFRLLAALLLVLPCLGSVGRAGVDGAGQVEVGRLTCAVEPVQAAAAAHFTLPLERCVSVRAAMGKAHPITREDVETDEDPSRIGQGADGLSVEQAPPYGLAGPRLAAVDRPRRSAPGPDAPRGPPATR